MNINNPASYQLDFQKIRKKTQINDIHSLESYLVNIFKDLSRRDSTEREEKSIDKITFIEYMKIPYIVGEKLFHVFDSNRDGLLSLTEFVSGIINLYSGGLEETQKIIFSLLDFDFDGKIIPEDSRLLIMFIKNLANPPSGVIKKLKPRSTLTDEEDLEEINLLIKNFFGDYSTMSYEEFKMQIENNNSDVFFLFICFLYNNKPFYESSIRVLKQSFKNNNNLNNSSNSMINSSFDNLFKNDRSRIKSPSKIFKSFIFDLVDIDLEEFEKDCEDNPSISENYKSDPDDLSILTNENSGIKFIPLFSAKINLERNKLYNDYIKTNTKNKKNFGSTIITKTYKNFLNRKENYKCITLKNKDNKLLNENNENIFENEAFYHNNTINNMFQVDREKLSVINEKGTFKNNMTNLNNQSNTFKNTFDTGIVNKSKAILGDEISENTNKNNLSGDGIGEQLEKLENANKNKLNKNINKSHTDFSNPFMLKNKLGKMNVTKDDPNFHGIEVLVQNKKLEANLTKNDFVKNRHSGMKLSIMSLDANNSLNITNTNINNNKILNSSGNVNRYLSPDSTRFSLSGEFYSNDIIFEGYIYRSDEKNYLKKYYTALVGNDLFYFSNSKKTKLKGIHNLSGTYIFKDPNAIKVREEYANNSKNSNEGRNEANNYRNLSQLSNNDNNSELQNHEGNPVKKNSNMNVQGENLVNKTVNYYPFKLYFKKKCRIFYCSSEEDVKKWVDNIRTVTKFNEITDFYNIGEELGHGKFGEVKVGNPKKKFSKNKLYSTNEDSKEEEKYAVKIISKINLKPIELELVKSEIEIMKFCRFRNIVKLIENYEDHENIYIILEYLSGGNLNHFLSSQKSLLTEDKIKKLILQIASGINYLHHFGIIHRDLKPENIMMSDKSEFAIVKIVDFGLSKVLGIFEKSNEAYGTLAYAAPEVIQKKDYNLTIDIWSLGVILYFLISGQFPFNDKNNNLHKIAMDITSGDIKFIGNSWKRADEDSKELVLRCLERDVTKRIDIMNFINHKWFNK